MPPLNIPSEHQSGLAKLGSFGEDVASSLLSAIERAADASWSVSAEQLGPIQGMSSSDKEEVIGTLNSLYQVRASAEVTVAEFVSDISDAMQHRVREEFAVPEDKLPAFRERISKFLNVDGLNRAAKAAVLRNDHEHPFCHARILTDARPVFGQDPAESPEAMIIFHMLKIAYHETSGIKEIYVALDGTDLEDIGEIIERAKKKASSLQKALISANIKVIDTN